VELRRYLHLIRQRWLLILVTTLVGASVGYATTSRTALYRSSATIYVGSRQVTTDPQNLYGTAGLNQIVSTFALMIPNQVIAQKAVAATHVDRAADQVAAETKATVITGTNLISVSVTDPDPVVAQSLTDGVATAFTNQVQTYEPGTTAAPGTLPAEPAYVFQRAYLPTVPLSTGLKKKVIEGGLAGLVISIFVVFLLDYLDISVKSPEDLERRVDLPVLGIIPFQQRVTGPPGRRPVPTRVPAGADDIG
jgi:capsular polysaccharide biosynthesis protein